MRADASIPIMRSPRRSSANHNAAPVSSPTKPVLSRNSAVPRSSSERGAGRLKAIIWTVILVGFVFTCVKLFPILLNQYEFQDGMQTIARFATVNRQTPEDIRNAVLSEAEKDSVPITADDIKVEAVNGNVHIRVNYSVTVDLLVYRWTLNFHPEVSNYALV